MSPETPLQTSPIFASPDGEVEAPAFAGFHGTLGFLTDLREHNERAWFEENRAVYEDAFVAPAAAFVEALGPRLRQLSRTVSFVPRINGSVFRIHRDVRFSRDKRPYKDHLALWFWEGPIKSMSVPGFYFQLAPDALILGVGLYRFDRNQLKCFRDAVTDPRKGASLEAALDAVLGGPYDVGAPARKRVPRGYDADHPRAGLLLHDGLTATWEGEPPRAAGSAEFVDWCVEHYRALLPIERWLTEHVMARPRTR